MKDVTQIHRLVLVIETRANNPVDRHMLTLGTVEQMCEARDVMLNKEVAFSSLCSALAQTCAVLDDVMQGKFEDDKVHAAYHEGLDVLTKLKGMR